MRHSLLLRGGSAAMLAALVSGCAASVESCDPNQVGNVLQSYSCDSQGYYGQRQQNLSANLDRISAAVEEERIAISQANRRIRDAQAQQRITSAQAGALNRQVAAVNNDVNRLARTSDPASQAALLQKIEKQKAAINGYSDITVF